MDGFFGGFEIMFFLMFSLIIAMFIFSFVMMIRQWKRNNNSPRLTVEATVVDKRKDVSYHHHHTGNTMGTMNTSSTSYLITFQVESGDRLVLRVSRDEYGMIVEGDTGKLTFQGTRYISFER
mgnify:CR=1 FL=1